MNTVSSAARRFEGARVVVTGGLGFIGSTLVHRLVAERVWRTAHCPLVLGPQPAYPRLAGEATPMADDCAARGTSLPCVPARDDADVEHVAELLAAVDR